MRRRSRGSEGGCRCSNVPRSGRRRASSGRCPPAGCRSSNRWSRWTGLRTARSCACWHRRVRWPAGSTRDGNSGRAWYTAPRRQAPAAGRGRPAPGRWWCWRSGRHPGPARPGSGRSRLAPAAAGCARHRRTSHARPSRRDCGPAPGGSHRWPPAPGAGGWRGRNWRNARRPDQARTARAPHPSPTGPRGMPVLPVPQKAARKAGLPRPVPPGRQAGLVGSGPWRVIPGSRYGPGSQANAETGGSRSKASAP